MEDIEKVITENLPLVHFVLKKYFYRYKNDEDIIQIGTISLWRAAVNYDSSRGIKFSTYAVKCIYMSIKKEIERQYKCIPTISLDESPDCNEKLSHLDMVVDPIDHFSSVYIKEGLRRVFDKISDRDKVIVEMIYEGYTYEEIGAHLGISKSRVGALVKNIVGVFHKYLDV